MRWYGHVARIREVRYLYKLQVGNPGWKGPLGRHWSRRNDNIKMDLKKQREYGVVVGIKLAQDNVQWLTIVKTMNLLSV
jgi:hypothetical protein